MTLIDEYFKLTKDYMNNYGKKTIVLMQVGSFFECYAKVDKDGNYHGSLILEFSKINDMAIAKKKCLCWWVRCSNGWFWYTFFRKKHKKIIRKWIYYPSVCTRRTR